MRADEIAIDESPVHWESQWRSGIVISTGSTSPGLLLGNCFSSSDFLELHGPGKVGVQGAEGVRFHCDSHWPEDWRMLRAEVEEKGTLV